MNLALEIAKQTMANTQAAMGVAMNNISNSQVDGYTRQHVNLTSNISILNGAHLVGTGAGITSIDRVRTGFYDKQYRDNLSTYSNSSALTTAYTRIESFFGSLDGDTGLKTSMNKFFDSLEELAKNPEKTGIKQVVRDSATAMIQSFNLVSNNIATMREQYHSFTEAKVNDINATLKNLQIVNDKIGRLSAMGQQPNDLLDERDRLIDSLSANMDISVVYAENNKVNIISNGQVLVQDGYSSQLKFTANIDNSISITFEDGSNFKSVGGDLIALTQVINETIPAYDAKLDTLAKDFIDGFNAIHMRGVATNGATGIAFFEGTSAKDIKISDAIMADASLVMSSADGTAGNNSIVLDLIAFKDSKSVDGGKFGVIEYFDNIAASISAETSASKIRTSNYKYITDEIYVMRSNEVGGNEDEEILTSVKLQQTYAAAAKVISTLNDMFSSLISAF